MRAVLRGLLSAELRRLGHDQGFDARSGHQLSKLQTDGPRTQNNSCLPRLRLEPVYRMDYTGKRLDQYRVLRRHLGRNLVKGALGSHIVAR